MTPCASEPLAAIKGIQRAELLVFGVMSQFEARAAQPRGNPRLCRRPSNQPSRNAFGRVRLEPAQVPGRPIMYGTTKFFLEHFGLSDLSQLPPLREFKELGEAEQALLPMDGEGVSSDGGSIETLDTGMESSVNGDLQASASLDENLDPIPAAQ